MHRCNTCTLSFQTADMAAEGLCKGCHAQAISRQQQQAQQRDPRDEELQRLRAQTQRQQPITQEVVDQFWGNNPLAARAAQQESIMTQQFPTMRAAAMNLARERNPELWDRHAAEIETLIDQTLPGAPQANVNTWVTGMTHVAGQHAMAERIDQKNAIIEARPRSASIRIPGEGPAGAGLPNAPSNAAAPADLTASEKTIADKFGITAQAYQKGKIAYEEQFTNLRDGKLPGDPLSPSPFDSIMIFTEEQKAERAKAKAA